MGWCFRGMNGAAETAMRVFEEKVIEVGEDEQKKSSGGFFPSFFELYLNIHLYILIIELITK